MSPNATRCFNRPVSLLSCHPISIDRWLLSPSTPTGSVFFCSYMCVWQRKREKEKWRLPSPGSPAASHVWIEARFFEMLKSQPVCCLSVWHTQNLVTHSPIHSPFFPSFLFPLLLTLSVSCKNVGLSCHYLQTEGEAKVCNSNKLVVKEKKGGKKSGLWRDLLPITPLRYFLETLFLLLCRHWKRALIKSELRSSLRARTHSFLSSYNVNHVTLPKRTISLSLVWVKGDLAARRWVNEDWVGLQCIQQSHCET